MQTDGRIKQGAGEWVEVHIQSYEPGLKEFYRYDTPEKDSETVQEGAVQTDDTPMLELSLSNPSGLRGPRTWHKLRGRLG